MTTKRTNDGPSVHRQDLLALLMFLAIPGDVRREMSPGGRASMLGISDAVARLSLMRHAATMGYVQQSGPMTELTDAGLDIVMEAVRHDR